MKSVLEKFRNSKLVLSYNFNLLRTSFKQFKNIKGSGLDIITLVSSAKGIGEEILFNTRGKSLMQIKNNRGPRMDPCGTPCDIEPQFE
jgi:hypothetical protein